MSLLAERAKQWEAEWFQQGFEQGVNRGIAPVRELLCRQAGRKFDPATAQELAPRIAGVTDTKRLIEVGGWIIDCATGAELLENMDAL